jgi:hypothetical protein
MTGILTQDTSNNLRRKMRRGRFLSPAGWRAVAQAIAAGAVLYFGGRVLVGVLIRNLTTYAGATPFILGAAVLAIGGGR